MRSCRGLAVAVAASLGSIAPLRTAVAGPASSASPPPIHVRAGRLVDGAGTPVTLIGVNRSGTEYACAQGWGVFDGPSSTASIEAIRAWGANTIRVPLNEDCWLGVNVPPTYSGAAYRRAIAAYVEQIGAAGMYAILDLHWGAPGDEAALGQEAMPDADHAIAFWSSVAATFQSDPGVVFEMFNEPHGVSWHCWRDGCTMPGGWQAVGMQQLVDTVRATGARQPIVLDGLAWANDLTGWLMNRPDDPLRQLAAGLHVYPWNACATAACWNAEVAPVASHVPVVASEVGERECNGRFAGTFLQWSARDHISPIAWAWDTDEGCGADLIAAYSGLPTTYGRSVLAAFRGLARCSASTAWSAVAAPGRPPPKTARSRTTKRTTHHRA